MARPKSLQPKTVKQLVQEQRNDLYATGHRNLNMALRVDVIAQLDAWKQSLGLRARDAVVALVLEQCMATTLPDAFVQHASDPGATLKRISPIVPGELAGYMKRVQGRFRNQAYGPLFEMMVRQVASEFDRFSARKHEAEPGGDDADHRELATSAKRAGEGPSPVQRALAVGARADTDGKALREARAA